MSILRGKGIWTLKEDLEVALAAAHTVGARYILCAVSEQGVYDAKQASFSLRMVSADPDLTPVAWIYPYLDEPEVEAEGIQQALEAGFAAVVLDAGFHTARKFVQAEKFAQRVRELGLDTARIYLCGEAYLESAWRTFPYRPLSTVCQGGYLPRVYDETSSASRKRKAWRVITNTLDQYALHQDELGYPGAPMPVLGASWDAQGRASMTQAELAEWCQAVEEINPEFVSLFRAGTVNPMAWAAFEKLKVGMSVMMLALAGAVEAIIVQPDGPGYSLATYVPGSAWKLKFVDMEGRPVYVRNTVKNQTVAATYTPAIPAAGRYTIDVFIPGTHATTRGARYFVVHHPNGERKDPEILINQYDYSDRWVPLGTFDVDPALPESGRVNLVDVTRDTSTKEIAFSAIRWQPVGGSGPTPPGGAGYDAPVGTPVERASPQVWPGSWFDATGYAVTYPDSDEYHTGADLNLNVPVYDSDRYAPVYATGDGVVAHALNVPGSWGGLIVIRHAPLPDGTPVYSRYAHVEQVSVQTGATVSRGQQIAVVGYYAPGKNYHLHFDISCTNKLDILPRHWPDKDKSQVLAHYVDPRKFIAEHRLG